MRLTATSTVIAGVLATAALASPKALARPNLEPTTSPAQSSATAPAVLPNPNQQPRYGSRVGPPILPAAAAAQQPEVHRVQTEAASAFAYKRPVSARYSTAALNGYDRAPTRGTSIVHVTPRADPFDWGAAAIGAAGGLVIALLIIGGGISVSQHRRLNPNRAKALA